MLLPVRAAAEDITIKARSAILVEVNTGEVLYSQAADIMQYPASLTKLMTALIVYERCDLGEIVTVTESALAGLSPDGSSSGLKPGEMMSVENLLYCMLISSGNDSASVLGEHTGGSVEAFVEMMNNRANELGCTGTNFENPHGLHDANHYTTARDMYIIAHEFIKHEKLMEIANTISYVVPATNKSPQRILNTTNYLISGTKTIQYIYSYARGIKTGSTTPAGYCLVSSAEKNGLYLISIVLGAAKDADTGEIMSFVEAKRLFEYGFNNFSYKKLVSAGEPIVEVNVDMSQGTNTVVAVTQSEITYLMRNDFDASKVVITPNLYQDVLTAPVTKGQILGEADVSYEGKSYGRVKLVALTGVERSNFLYSMEKLKEYAKKPAFIYGAIGILAAVIGYIVITVMIHRKKRLRMIKKRGRYL
jgi:D-alanyl-D-alanine carboxypeptidase (penicillin-binding protein 5/6)